MEIRFENRDMFKVCGYMIETNSETNNHKNKRKMNTKNFFSVMMFVFLSILLSCEKNEMNDNSVIHEIGRAHV